ncbi:hypothetical protein GCM10027569_91410 [Flindersiella endophytica]
MWWERSWLLRALMIFCLGAAGFVTMGVPFDSSSSIRALRATTAEPPRIENLGPASSVTATTVADQVGDRLYTATAGVSPVVVGAYDAATKRIDRKFPLPTGDGVWGMTHLGTDLYVGTYGPGHLYKIDTVAGTVTKVADMGQWIWALTVSPDGKIFAGTYPNAEVYEYDPATGRTKNHGVVQAGEKYVRSIAVTGDTIFAGIGSHAHLIAIDRSSGAKRDLLPAKYADRTFVATLDIAGDTLAAALSPTATMLVYDLRDLSAPPREVQPPDDSYVTAATVEPSTGDVYFGTRPSGTLYHWVASSGELKRLGQPFDGATFYRIFPSARTIRGQLAGHVVDYDVASGEFSLVDLAEAGLPAQPELPMAVTISGGRALVSGKGGIQVHDLAGGDSTRISLVGEAKTMTPVGRPGRETVYLGVYTLARLFQMRSDRPGNDYSLAELDPIRNEQTRPTDATYVASRRALLVGTEPDYGKLNGALSIRDQRDGKLDVYRGVIPNQTVLSVAATDHNAYLGSSTRNGLGTDPIVKEATLSQFDLRTRKVRWQITPVPGATAITDVEVYRGLVYLLTNTGKLAVVDPTRQTVLSVTQAGAGWGSLVQAGGGLYGADGFTLFRIDPAAGRDSGDPPRVTVLVEDLDSEWYGSRPLLAAAPDGRSLFALQGRDLVRVWL